MKTKPLLRTALGTVIGVAMTTAPVAATAAEDDIVLIQGVSFDEETLDFLGASALTVDDKDALIEAACNSTAVNDAMEKLKADLANQLRQHGEEYWDLDNENESEGEQWLEDRDNLDLQVDAYNELADLKKKACTPRDRNPVKTFTIIYTSCAMYMQEGGQEMLIVLPPSIRGAGIILREPGEDPITADLNVGAAMMDGPSVNATMQDAKVTLASGNNRGTHLGARTRLYDTSYNGSAAMPFPGMSGVQITSEGHAWVSPGAPGLDVVRAFHRNFASEVNTPGIVNGFMAGLIDQMAAITEKGMPLDITHTTNVQSPFAPFMEQDSFSRQIITGLGVLPRANASGMLADFCNATIIAEGEEVQDLNEMMGNPNQQQATSAAQSEMDRAMQEAREQMERLGVSIPGF